MATTHTVYRGCFTRLAAFGLVVYAVSAQTPPAAPNFTFSYQNPTTGALVSVAQNGTVNFGSTPVQQSTGIQFFALNQGSDSYTVTITSISGSTFSGPTDGRVVNAGATGLFTLTFTPPSAGPQAATMVVQVQNNSNTASYVFSLAGTGTAPQFVLSYIIGTGGNQVAVQNQATITFPQTTVNQSSSATFVIGNTGNGDGTVSAVTWSGASFNVTGLALLPATVTAGKTLQFTITFSPTARGQFTGALTVTLGATTNTINLAGQGVGASLQYQTVINNTTAQVAPGATITIPPVAIGSTAVVMVTVTNAGDANGSIGSISIHGTGYQLTQLPTLPATLAPGQSASFQINYTPSASGPSSATLLIDNAMFNVAAVGLGASLQVAVGSNPIANNGVINFPNTQVGGNNSLALVLTNQGNASRTVNSIAVSGAGFSVTGLPTLPVTLNAGDMTTFTVVLTPTTIATATGSLQIDELSFSLRGAGTAPPALPAVSFTNAPATSQPLQQPQVGVTLANPYPFNITGALTLTFSSNSFVDDPAIQFAVGNRTVNFVIPANTTVAQFGQVGNQIQFQTGTVAGSITLTASFNVASVSITPSAAPTTTVTLAPAAPVIRSIQVGTQNASGFELLITGYSNTRSMASLALQFSGTNLSGAQQSVPVDAAFGAWYQSSASAPFGSQFTASVFVNVNGTISNVQSVSATLTNSVGTSPAVSLNVP